MGAADELRRIADQIERWATHGDVGGPGLPDAETLRDAARRLDDLGMPEPDYHDDPAGWQRWRDRTTAALLAGVSGG